MPLAVIATTRPEIEDAAPGFLGREGRRRTVDLQTLGPEQAAALLSGLTGDAAFADTPFAETLITNAGGNPLFLEETVRMLRDEGLLELERWQSDEMRRRPDPDQRPGTDQLAPRPAGAEGEAARPPRIGDRRRSSGPARSPVSAPRTTQRREDPRTGPLGARAPRLRRPPEGLLGPERRGVLVQAHPDARRRVRPGAEGPSRAAPSRLHRMGEGPAEQRRRVRGDRRVAPRAGVPARARGHAKPDRTADPRGRGHARRRGAARRAPREPARGASLLHAGPRPARRRARRPARDAARRSGRTWR